jgi:hypothetical protein
MEGGKPILVLKTTVNQWISGCGKKKKLLFETLITLVILYGCEVWGCNISRESWRNTKKVEDEKHFLLNVLHMPTLNLNFKIFVTIPTFLTFNSSKLFRNIDFHLLAS